MINSVGPNMSIPKTYNDGKVIRYLRMGNQARRSLAQEPNQRKLEEIKRIISKYPHMSVFTEEVEWDEGECEWD